MGSHLLQRLHLVLDESNAKMMKLVVLAVAVSAVCGGVVPLAYSGLPVGGAITGLPVGGAITGLPVGSVYSGLAPLSTVSHTGYSVAPQPYSVHTGTKVEVAAEPVEQHGYVIKY